MYRIGKIAKEINVNHISHRFQAYNNNQVNKINGVWGLILILDGLFSFSYTIWPKKEKPKSRKSY